MTDKDRLQAIAICLARARYHAEQAAEWLEDAEKHQKALTSGQVQLRLQSFTEATL